MNVLYILLLYTEQNSPHIALKDGRSVIAVDLMPRFNLYNKRYCWLNIKLFKTDTIVD